MKKIISITLGLIYALCVVTQLSAAETKYPVICYEGDKLEEIRSWEKEWADKKIDDANIEQVKEFLPDSLYDLFTDTEKWGKHWFRIVPYRTISPSKGKIEMTLQYAGKTKIGKQGECLNWVSGVPFPNATTGVEMAHNFRNRCAGDSIKTDESALIVDGRLKYDMDIKIKNNYFYFSGRTDVQPVPELPDNKKQIWRAFTMLQLDPPEARDMRIMEINYKDKMKSYDSWYWLPAIRRIRRRSTSERQDALGGGDFAGYDNFGWDGPVQINKYKNLGQKDLLMPRHNPDYKDYAGLHVKGDCIFNGIKRERIKMHVVEVENQNPNFMYSKMIWYLDPETWQMLYSDRYDRNGKLWKVLEQFSYDGKGMNDVPVDFFSGNQMVDVQRRHSTIAYGNFDFGLEMSPRMFTFQYLRKRAY